VSEATRTIREISQAITLGNPKVVARLTREAELGTMAPAVFINLLDRGWGRPIPMVAEKPGLYFVNYRSGDDPMRQKTDRMISERNAELALLAIQEGRQDPELIIAARGVADANATMKNATDPKAPAAKEADGVFEELEAVKPDMPDLSAVRDMLPPQRSQYERDRLPRGER
jgi:hypothetical protein